MHKTHFHYNPNFGRISSRVCYPIQIICSNILSLFQNLDLVHGFFGHLWVFFFPSEVACKTFCFSFLIFATNEIPTFGVWLLHVKKQQTKVSVTPGQRSGKPQQKQQQLQHLFKNSFNTNGKPTSNVEIHYNNSISAQEKKKKEKQFDFLSLVKTGNKVENETNQTKERKTPAGVGG